jgi:HSP20 family molecular chaperone IbpA
VKRRGGNEAPGDSMVRAMLLALLLALARPRATRADERPSIPVVVRETPDGVRLRIRLPPGGDPESVEVRLDGRAVHVLAADGDGHEMRSDAIALGEAVVESGAAADYDGVGWLTITLRRARR